jgi:hypothetical protein
MESEAEVDTIDQLEQKWNNAAPLYQQFDSCPQTFYYTLIHMLRFDQAHHIL